MFTVGIRFLHTNDMHGTLDERTQSRLAELRNEADLFFDSGDCIKTGNLGIPLSKEPVWERLADLRCDASVLGNRESHLLNNVFDLKMAGASHPFLASNMTRRDGTRVTAESLMFEVAGVKIGVIGVMVPMVTRLMRTQAASSFIWEQPIPEAIAQAVRLRGGVDLLVALTHIGHRQDVELAERCPAIDIIFGGHSHTVLEEPQRIGTTTICQGGSHNRFAGQYEWRDGALSGGLVALK